MKSIPEKTVSIVIGIFAVFFTLVILAGNPPNAFTFQSPFDSPLPTSDVMSKDSDGAAYPWGGMSARPAINYTPAPFCPPTPIPTVLPTQGDNFVYLPVVMNAPNRYGVAGADRGNDSMGECPNTNEMSALGLPSSSLSYEWNFGSKFDTNPVQMIYNMTQREIDDAEIFAAGHPGHVWILGNEPDKEGQTGLCPNDFVKQYYEARQTILGADPTARIAVGAISQWPDIECTDITDTWEDYVIAMLETYSNSYTTVMPIDIWTIHRYPSTDPYLEDPVQAWITGEDKFGPGVEEMVNYIRYLDVDNDGQHEYANTPIWLTEFGMPDFEAHNHEEDDDIQDFMIDASHWLQGYGEIENWFWYAGRSGHTADGCWPAWSRSGYLILQDQQITDHYQALEGGTTQTLRCAAEDCGDVSWDRYSILWVKLHGKWEKRRVKSFQLLNESEVEITVCSSPQPFPYPIEAGTEYYLVRQVPHFKDGHEVPNDLGTTYYELATGQR